MAKLAYSKLGLSKAISKDLIKTINFNDVEIEITQYLPIEKKLELISDIINKSLDDNNYFNPCRIEIFKTIEIILAYTNLSTTEKQREDIFKLYDSFMASGFLIQVIEAIPTDEYEFINNSVMKTIENIYKQRNSAMGILDAVTNDYSDLNLEALNIQQLLADPSNLDLLKGILTKLG